MKPGKKMLAAILAMIAAFILVAVFGIGDDIKGISEMRYGIDIRGGVEAVFEADGREEKPTEQELKTVREVMEMRLDAQNITDREVTIDKEGGYLIVRFPWKSDETEFHPEDAITELGEMAQLTFRDPDGKVLIDGRNVAGSSAQRDNTSMSQGYVVKLEFNDEGAALFEQATGALIGRQMGIYMDDDLISNPMVETKISGGQAVISGMENFEEAKELSDKINAGALPFSLKTTSFSAISPTLGGSALEVMMVSGLIAFAAVCGFMIFYYKLPGCVACATLVLQITLQLLALSIPQYTLTLPGIAGIILSLGMAVDANIIISERIMEELKKGYSVRASIKNGYQHGFSSVLDGNITTAVVAVILMVFGSGSMLSFGYTLLAGMVINLLAGVTVSKQILLSVILFKKWNDERWFRKKKEIWVKQFYQKKWICAVISGAVFLIGIGGCVLKGVELDTQFTGGAVLNYTADAEMDLGAVRSKVAQVTDRAVTVQASKSNLSEERSIEITLAGTEGISPDEQKAITEAVKQADGEKEVTLAQTYAVEPYIGEKALRNSGIAILLSFLFIMLYVAVRFSVLSGFAAGMTALIALVHDVLVVFFVFVLAGIPLNDAFVAVTLTTGICVLSVLAAAVLFQITSIFEFALPMFFGLISGCYSSVCIASILWVMWEKRKEDKDGR